MLFIFSSKCNICVHQAGHHADVDSNAVQPREDVISADEHTNVGDGNIFEASDYGRGQSWVVLRTEYCAVVEHEAHDAGEEELYHKKWIWPLIIVEGIL